MFGGCLARGWGIWGRWRCEGCIVRVGGRGGGRGGGLGFEDRTCMKDGWCGSFCSFFISFYFSRKTPSFRFSIFVFRFRFRFCFFF